MAAFYSTEFLLVQELEVLVLGLVDCFVVDLWQGIELRLEGGEMGGLPGIFEWGKLAQVGVHGVKGIDADG